MHLSRRKIAHAKDFVRNCRETAKRRRWCDCSWTVLLSGVRRPRSQPGGAAQVTARGKERSRTKLKLKMVMYACWLKERGLVFLGMGPMCSKTSSKMFFLYEGSDCAANSTKTAVRIKYYTNHQHVIFDIW